MTSSQPIELSSEEEAEPEQAGDNRQIGTYLLVCGCGDHSYVGAIKTGISARVQQHNERGPMGRAQWTAEWNWSEIHFAELRRHVAPRPLLANSSVRRQPAAGLQHGSFP